MGVKEELKNYAVSRGMLLGVAGAGPFTLAGEILLARQREGLLSGLEVGSLSQRTDPDLLLPGARSILALALPYYRAASWQGDYLLARAAWGRDYHQVLRAEGEALLGLLQELAGRPVRGLVLVDHNPLVEREVARRAGLGWQGKNCSLITLQYGSWVFLAEVLIDYELEPDSPLPSLCGGCNRCLTACPSGALLRPYTLAARSCLSLVTQARGWLSWEQRSNLGLRLYGCDTCQEACPYNHRPTPTARPEFSPSHPATAREVLHMDATSYRHWFGASAAAWRGRSLLQRNAALVLANAGGEEAVEDLRAAALGAASPIVRGHAAWSLATLGGSCQRAVLEQGLRQEKDPQVRHELKQILARF